MRAPDLYEIRVESHLGMGWSHWLGGLSIRNEDNGETVFSGPGLNQTAVLDVLAKILDLHLRLISVMRVKPEEVISEGNRKSEVQVALLDQK